MILDLRGDTVDNGVGDLAGGTGDEHALGCILEGGVVGAHGADGEGSGALGVEEGLGEHGLVVED